MKTQRRAPKQIKSDAGRPLCRMPACGNPVPKRRRSYCSRECAIEFEIAYFPTRTRSHVEKRDHGICALCGTDTNKLKRVIEWLRKICKARHETMDVFRELGFSGRWYEDGSYWQADHIQECAKGGWGKGLDNFRTLCTPCHKSETARLVRELAAEKKLSETTEQLFSPADWVAPPAGES